MTKNSQEPLVGYGAGKLTGSQGDGSLYARLRDRLAAKSIHLYLPREHTRPGEQSAHPMKTAEDIFALDAFRVGLVDFMLCCLDEPSTGTGMELIIAMNGLVPTFSFHHNDRQLERTVSRMPVGNPANQKFGSTGRIPALSATDRIIYYSDLDDLAAQMTRQVEATRDIFERARNVKRQLDAVWRELDLGELLARRQTEKVLSDEDLAIKLGTTQEMVKRLRLSQADFERLFQKEVDNLNRKGLFHLVIPIWQVSALRYLNPSLVQIASLSAVLEMNLFDLIGRSLERAFGGNLGVAPTHDRVPDELRPSLAALRFLSYKTRPEVIEYLFHQEIASYYDFTLKKKAARYTAPDSKEWEERIERVDQPRLF